MLNVTLLSLFIVYIRTYICHLYTYIHTPSMCHSKLIILLTLLLLNMMHSTKYIYIAMYTQVDYVQCIVCNSSYVNLHLIHNN